MAAGGSVGQAGHTLASAADEGAPVGQKQNRPWQKQRMQRHRQRTCMPVCSLHRYRDKGPASGLPLARVLFTRIPHCRCRVQNTSKCVQRYSRSANRHVHSTFTPPPPPGTMYGRPVQSCGGHLKAPQPTFHRWLVSLSMVLHIQIPNPYPPPRRCPQESAVWGRVGDVWRRIRAHESVRYRGGHNGHGGGWKGSGTLAGRCIGRAFTPRAVPVAASSRCWGNHCTQEPPRACGRLARALLLCALFALDSLLCVCQDGVSCRHCGGLRSGTAVCLG